MSVSICNEEGQFVLIEFGVDEKGDLIGVDALGQFLDDWNKDNQTNYKSRQDFNSGETKYYIKKLSKFTISFSLVGNGSMEVYGRDEKDAKESFLENIDIDELLEVTYFDDGLEVDSLTLEDEGDDFPERNEGNVFPEEEEE